MTKIHKATQMKIWKKNVKDGYHFFQPQNATKLTPRTHRQAVGYSYYSDVENETIWNKIIITFVICVVILSVLSLIK
jgi:hypothetical protein